MSVNTQCGLVCLLNLALRLVSAQSVSAEIFIQTLTLYPSGVQNTYGNLQGTPLVVCDVGCYYLGARYLWVGPSHRVSLADVCSFCFVNRTLPGGA